VRFGAAFWVQRTRWPELREACLTAEAAGFDTIWFDDHLLSDEGDWRDGKLEGWATLAALAPLTSVRLGHLVVANTFRNPGLTAKMAATLDQLSGGRFVLGLGGGWFEREHDAFGLDFGAGFGERLDRLEEAVDVIERLLAGERVTHHGRFYDLVDAVCEPRPVQARLPILIGGTGREKTLRTTARHADLWNGYGDPQATAASIAVLRERCAEVGRDPAAIEATVPMDIVIRKTADAALAEFEAVKAHHGITTRADGTVRQAVAAGPPEAVAEVMRRYEAVGVAEVMWIFRSPFDLQTMERLPAVREALSPG
jgi:alkanesulfonate monooxygenase SsuD/methylene tetrahydromethanopterin reductase-like flavin-dependent oxidoreductase (luciferase family)